MEGETDVTIAEELGRDLRHLIDLAGSQDDPHAVVLGEEIERLSADDARALLMCAALMLWQHETDL